MSEKYETVFTTVVRGTDRRMVKDGTLAIYDVFTEDGTQWSTFKADLYNLARQLDGQLADWKGAIEQRDNFTNRTLLNIRAHPTDGTTATPPSQGRQAAEQAQQAQQAKQIDYDQFKAAQSEQELRKQESIHRQTAGKVAAAVSRDAQEFWANIQDIKVYFDSGVVPLPYSRQSTMKSHAGDEPAHDEWGNTLLPEVAENVERGRQEAATDSSFYNPGSPDADIPF